MTGGKAFLDTNVLLRATTPGLPLHDEARELMLAQQDANIEL